MSDNENPGNYAAKPMKEKDRQTKINRRKMAKKSRAANRKKNKPKKGKK